MFILSILPVGGGKQTRPLFSVPAPIRHVGVDKIALSYFIVRHNIFTGAVFQLGKIPARKITS
jgi:hypothetical protein